MSTPSVVKIFSQLSIHTLIFEHPISYIFSISCASFIQALDDPFDESCLIQMITIWELAQDWIEERQKPPLPANDFEADEDDTEAENGAVSLAEDMCMSILYFLTRMVRKATDKQLDESLHKQSPRTIIKLIDVLNANDTEEDIKECCQKLNGTFERLNRTSNDENGSVASQ